MYGNDRVGMVVMLYPQGEGRQKSLRSTEEVQMKANFVAEKVWNLTSAWQSPILSLVYLQYWLYVHG